MKMMEETGTDTLLKMFISNVNLSQFSLKTTFILIIYYFNKNREQQWEEEWHLTMQLYSCITWKPTFQQGTQKNQKFG